MSETDTTEEEEVTDDELNTCKICGKGMDEEIHDHGLIDRLRYMLFGQLDE